VVKRKAMKIEYIPGTRNVRLLEDFVVETSIGNITIPKLFVSDFASIPRGAWFLAAPTDPGIRAAALVHDWFYRERKARLVAHDGVTPVVVTRAMADQIFLEELEDGGLPAWKRQPMYWAVRLFGGSSWRE